MRNTWLYRSSGEPARYCRFHANQFKPDEQNTTSCPLIKRGCSQIIFAKLGYLQEKHAPVFFTWPLHCAIRIEHLKLTKGSISASGTPKTGGDLEAYDFAQRSLKFSHQVTTNAQLPCFSASKVCH